MERQVWRDNSLLLFLEEMRVVIGAGAVAAAFGNRFGALHHERAARFAVAEK